MTPCAWRPALQLSRPVNLEKPLRRRERLAFDLCPRAYVLEAGRIVASGKSEQLRSDESLRSVYFGPGATGGATREEHR